MFPNMILWICYGIRKEHYFPGEKWGLQKTADSPMESVGINFWKCWSKPFIDIWRKNTLRIWKYHGNIMEISWKYHLRRESSQKCCFVSEVGTCWFFPTNWCNDLGTFSKRNSRDFLWAQWTGWREKSHRKPWFLPLNMGVSCKCSLKPIILGNQNQKQLYRLYNPSEMMLTPKDVHGFPVNYYTNTGIDILYNIYIIYYIYFRPHLLLHQFQLTISHCLSLHHNKNPPPWLAWNFTHAIHG